MAQIRIQCHISVFHGKLITTFFCAYSPCIATYLPSPSTFFVQTWKSNFALNGIKNPCSPLPIPKYLQTILAIVERQLYRRLYLHITHAVTWIKKFTFSAIHLQLPNNDINVKRLASNMKKYINNLTTWCISCLLTSRNHMYWIFSH